MKERFLSLLKRLGHFQAQLLLTLLFVLVVSPYGILLRLTRGHQLPGGRWAVMEQRPPTLSDLRRSF
jgi:hypothetical protein